MLSDHKRSSSKTKPARLALASALSCALLFPSAAAALAQSAAPELPNTLSSEPAEVPLYGRLTNPNPENLITGSPDYAPAPAPEFTPEEEAIVADSPLNHLPEAPPRAEGAGTVVNTEEASLMIDDRLWDAKATRYQYRSTDSLGNASEDTAIYIDPNKPWTGPGERPLVAVPAGTQGTGQHCDPSLSIQSGPEIRIDPFDMVFPYEAIPVGVHLERGAAVVLIDHHRNADGHQAYLDNIASGQSTLDAIAAAQELGVSPEAPVGIHGYSQGGGAAAAAAERAEVYAPSSTLSPQPLVAPPSAPAPPSISSTVPAPIPARC